jgi:hypothetical protein
MGASRLEMGMARHTFAGKNNAPCRKMCPDLPFMIRALCICINALLWYHDTECNSKLVLQKLPAPTRSRRPMLMRAIMMEPLLVDRVHFRPMQQLLLDTFS